MQPKASARGPGLLRLGFIPLIDCATLVVAHEEGYFREQGLSMLLSRELGWASIRDKVLYGQLDAGHALGAMPLAARLGIGSPAVPCLTAYILNGHGNAITLSQRLWDEGVRDGHDFAQLARSMRRRQPLTLGVVFSTSSHHFLMLEWLRRHELDPKRDVRLVVLPPPQVCRNLEAGTIDGYCVGEPWNSLAVQRGVGWIVSLSSELDRGHPEKALMLRDEMVERRPDAHRALIVALDKASRLCDEPDYRPRLAKLLARPEYLNCDERLLLPSLVGPLVEQMGLERRVDGFHRFSGSINRPDCAKADWYVRGLASAGLIPADSVDTVKQGEAKAAYRLDLYESCLGKSAVVD